MKPVGVLGRKRSASNHEHPTEGERVVGWGWTPLGVLS